MNTFARSAALDKLAALNPRCFIVYRQGRILTERYREPQMASQPAIINSCTKSVLSALLCVAIKRRLLPDPERTPAALFFPQLAADTDVRKRDLTLAHLLTMTAGFAWNEFGGMNSFPRMTRSPDWVAHVLEQPLADAPGTVMNYNSGVSQLLSAILTQATGKSVAAFAEETLFGALDIQRYEWETDPQGIHTGGFGLRLLPADLLKLGRLMLQRGRWGEEMLFSAELAERAVSPFAPATPPYAGLYGWHWWCGSYEAGPGQGHGRTQGTGQGRIRGMEQGRMQGTEQGRMQGTKQGMEQEAEQGTEQGRLIARHPYFYAQGFGGQYLYVAPKAELIAVITQDSRKRKRADLFAELVLPFITGL